LMVSARSTVKLVLLDAAISVLIPIITTNIAALVAMPANQVKSVLMDNA
jgi:hypothetical protein